MEISNFKIARPEFRELRRGPLSQHAHADVILIDQSQVSLQKGVFQLNAQLFSSIDQIDRLKQDIANLRRDSFAFLGEAIEVNTDNKTILLKEGNLMTYKYLIMVASSPDGDFHVFLQALKDVMLFEALNARAKITEGKATPLASLLSQSSNPSYSIPSEACSSKLPSLAQKRIAESDKLDSQANQKVVPTHLCQVKN